jgi:serine/threonine protein kinase/tetratricopeptide (TPR) repeat protein
MPAEPQSLKEVFLAALAVAPEKRVAWLEQACGQDADLRRHVQLMLAAHDSPQSLLDRSAPADARRSPLPASEPVATVDAPITERPGTAIGPYKLLEQIGEGGFGVVFRAEQTEPVRRKVALKVLKPGMDTRQVVARFEAERQALAIMDHPNIAKVFDGGIVGQVSKPADADDRFGNLSHIARPYFVMELVQGVPITRYCDEHHLTLKQRLDLFLRICEAVQHAHQKGVIHRDLKPSNVLIGDRDDKPVLKVIDFGVAKAMGQQLTEKTLFTGASQMIGTPLYMSPEQAGGNGLDVDTRSDIYSLGAVLYELLTRTTPIDKERLQKAGYDEIRRIICEEEPPKPSTRISTMGQASTTISTQRKSDPKRLSQLIRGELDWIVMKALEKDRNRRYETASALAADVQHYLNDEPVQACPPSALYRFRKFARRHRAAFVIATIGTAMLLLAVFGLTLGLIVVDHEQAITREAMKAESEAKESAQKRLSQLEKANAILSSIFHQLNPEAEEKGGPNLRVQLGEQLDEAATLLEGEAVSDPLTVASMQNALGTSLRALGHYQQALQLLEKAYHTTAAELGPDHLHTLTTKHDLARLYLDQGKYTQAEPLFNEVLKSRTAQLGTDHRATLATKSNLASLYRCLGKYDQAEALCREVLGAREGTLGADHTDTLMSYNNLAVLYQAQEKYEQAERMFEDLLKRAKAKLGSDHVFTLNCKYNLAFVGVLQGKYPEAENLYKEVLAAQTARLGVDHPSTLTTKHGLAELYRSRGMNDQSESLLAEVLQARTAHLGPDHPETLAAKDCLGVLYYGQQKYESAEPLFREALEGCTAKLGVSHPDTLISKNNLAMLYKALEKYERAELLLKEVIAIRSANLGPDHPFTLNTKNDLGLLYKDQRKLDQTEPLYIEVLEGRAAKLGEEHPQTLVSKNNLAMLYKAQGKYERAEPLFNEVIAVRTAKLGADHVLTLGTKNNLAWLYREQAKARAAELLFQEVLEKRTSNLGADHPDTLTTMNDLGTLYWSVGKLDRSVPLFEELLRRRQKNLGADHPETLRSAFNLAINYRDVGRMDDAVGLFDKSLDRARAVLPPGHSVLEFGMRARAETFARAGRFDKAETLLRQLTESTKQRAGAGSLAYAGELAKLGFNLLRQNKLDDAEKVLRECLTLRENKEPNGWKTFDAKSVLGGALLAQERYTEAEPLLLQGYEGMKQREAKIPAEFRNPRLTESLERLVQLYETLGQAGKTDEWRMKLQAQQAEQKGKNRSSAEPKP